MDNAQRNLIKKKILKCLTEDFKNNQAIFDKKEGWQCFNGTDLDMVMDKVVKGLEMAKHDINKGKGEKDLIAGVVGSLPSRQDYLKTMLDWHDEYLKDGNFNIPLDHEQSEYLSWLANRLAKVYGQ